MIIEGINECKIAAALCKDWDTPLVEPGIILINMGRYDEALVELESAVTKLPTVTPHLAMNRGYALMQIGKHEQALNDFEFVIKTKPNYAPALGYAAHCSFMIGDQKRGMKYAKEARKYGESRTYNDCRKGAYRNESLNTQK
jgi:tetratricopeptide (TPR) repeat protein